MFKIRLGLIREHGVGKDILLAGGQIAHLFAQLVQLPGNQVGRALFDQLFLAHGALLERFVDRRRRLAVPALEVFLHLVGDGLVALARQHVDHRLGTHNLGGGCDQGRVTEVLAYPWNFLEDVLDTIQRTLFLQLVSQVGHHSARYLGQEHRGINTVIGALELVVFLAHFPEVACGLVQKLQVQAGFQAGIVQCRHQGFRGRMAGAAGKGRQGGINMVNAGFHGRPLAHGRHARSSVGVQEYR